MTAVVQRVSSASVKVDGKICGACQKGLFILLGVAADDTENDAVLLAEKIKKLRIFSDENGKMNLSVNDVEGSALVVSNFTLLANYKHGNRPDFFGAASPDKANCLYEYFVSLMKESLSTVETGIFGADMKIEASCDGPVTIVLESEVLKKNGKDKN